MNELKGFLMVKNGGIAHFCHYYNILIELEAQDITTIKINNELTVISYVIMRNYDCSAYPELIDNSYFLLNSFIVGQRKNINLYLKQIKENGFNIVSINDLALYESSVCIRFNCEFKPENYKLIC